MKETHVVKYDITEAAIAKMEDVYLKLKVSGVDDEDGFKAVHDARMVVVKHRTGVDKRRKELKADALAWGRKVDSEAKKIWAKLEPIETHLSEQEKIVTDEKKRIKEAEEKAFQEKINNRMNSLAGYNAPMPYQQVATMTDEEFDEKLLLVKEAWEYEHERIKIAEEQRKAEEARIAAERKAENERLEKIRAEQEKQMAEIKAEQEKIAAEKAKIKAEQDKIERETAIKEAEEKARLQAIADEKARAELERIHAEEKAAAEKAEAERVAALLPDKEKAIAWVESVRNSLPKMATVKDRDIRHLMVNTLDQIKTILDVLHRDIEGA